MTRLGGRSASCCEHGQELSSSYTGCREPGHVLRGTSLLPPSSAVSARPARTLGLSVLFFRAHVSPGTPRLDVGRARWPRPWLSGRSTFERRPGTTNTPSFRTGLSRTSGLDGVSFQPLGEGADLLFVVLSLDVGYKRILCLLHMLGLELVSRGNLLPADVYCHRKAHQHLQEPRPARVARH